MAGTAEHNFRRASGDRSWEALAPGTRRRWVGAYGGPRSLPPAERARRAELLYQAGAQLPAAHTGHAPQPAAHFSAVATTEGVIALISVSYNERRRLGQYAHNTRELLAASRAGGEEYRQRARAFERRWKRRSRTVGDAELEWRADRVVAAWAIHGPASQPFYRRVAA